jgi:ubiquinone biosynthesis protein Coq4
MFFVRATEEREPPPEENEMSKLFDGARFLIAYARLVRNVDNLDIVFNLINEIVDRGDDEKLAPMLALPSVQAMLARHDAPLVLDLVALRELPEGTLGRTFAEFIDSRGFSIEDLYRHDPREQTEARRLQIHLERSHDLWHVVTGFDTDKAGELGLQAFYLAQFEGAIAGTILSAGLLNGVLFEPEDLRRRMEAIATGWGYGKAARSLLGTNWAALLDQPLSEVRVRFGITPEQVATAGRPQSPELAAMPTAA